MCRVGGALQATPQPFKVPAQQSAKANCYQKNERLENATDKNDEEKECKLNA